MRNCSARVCVRSALPGESVLTVVSWFLVPALFWSPLFGTSSEDPRVDFQRRIRPMFSDACFQCHLPDAKTRMAGLRLDLRDALF